MNQNVDSSLGEMREGEYRLRGTPLSALISEKDFVSAFWFAWTGKRPNDVERALLNACCVACLDHGQEPPSAHVARVVSSCGKPSADAVAAGLLTLGQRHGQAGSQAAHLFRLAVADKQSPSAFVEEMLLKGNRLPGFGHAVYEEDPRARTLVQIAKSELASAPHVDFALDVSAVLSEAKQKPLPLNVDGAIGAIMADIGAPDFTADAIFLMSRTVGLIAHAQEASGLAKYIR